MNLMNSVLAVERVDPGRHGPNEKVFPTERITA